MLDMLDVFAMTKPGFSLNGVYDIVQNNGVGKDGRLFHVKNAQGFPVDLRNFDDRFFYDGCTEFDQLGWTDPTAVKIHTGSNQKGNVICPRYVVAGFPLPECISLTSPYMVMKGGAWDWAPHSVNQIRYTMGEPYMYDWGGDVGKGLTYKLVYQWGGLFSAGDGVVQYSDLETYEYVPPFGLVFWQHKTFDKNNRIYVPANDSGIHNKLMPLATPKLVFPILV